MGFSSGVTIVFFILSQVIADGIARATGHGAASLTHAFVFFRA
jgi:hypothetical protein